MIKTGGGRDSSRIWGTAGDVRGERSDLIGDIHSSTKVIETMRSDRRYSFIYESNRNNAFVNISSLSSKIGFCSINREVQSFNAKQCC